MNLIIHVIWNLLVSRGENGELRVGVRRLMRQLSNMPSSVISSHSMHLGVLATASHAIATKTLFSVFYKPRFVSPLNLKWLLVACIILLLSSGFLGSFRDIERKLYAGTRAQTNDYINVNDCKTLFKSSWIFAYFMMWCDSMDTKLCPFYRNVTHNWLRNRMKSMHYKLFS